jgi:hypothetical protein
MGRSTTPLDGGKMTVFRARRRCPKCGLVNADNASRCRRCGQSFSTVDRAAESERVVAALQAWKIAAGILAVLLVAGAFTAAYLYKEKLDRLSAYSERSRAVEADLVALRRGAEADASLIAKAFDDDEVRRLLAEQQPTWKARASQCDSLASQVDDLVPQDPAQTEHELGLERDLASLESASKTLVQAAAGSDVFSARVAAAKLAQTSGS